MYAIKFTDEGLADVKALSRSARNSLRKEIAGKLARDPYGCSTELRAPLRGWRSFHHRHYGVVFKVYEDLRAIAVAGVGRRLPQSSPDIYKKLEALAAEGKLAESVLSVLRGFPSRGRTRPG